jgi:predicted patatin/cPLA2 family phospholipase
MRFFQKLSFLLVLVLLQACASIPERNPLPMELADEAEIPNIPLARRWGDVPAPYQEKWLATPNEILHQQFHGIVGVEHNYLSISGGGANGAYTAGVMVAWTELETRPQFTIVTGISTGALVAPFVFLGSDYDNLIKELYTETSTADIFFARGLIEFITGDSAVNPAPVRGRLAQVINEDFFADLTTEARKGRKLLISTTNIDAMRPVVWDLTAIALSGDPHALQLIRDIMLASASIPVAFPPVMFEVEADGQRYDEMHVDGGVTSQVFFHPAGVRFKEALTKLEVPGTPKLYVIRNSKLRAQWQTVDRSLVPIAVRTIDSLIRTQGIGDLFQIYLVAKEDGIDVQFAGIPDDFDAPSTEAFDMNYMQALFQRGYEDALQGKVWKKPSFEE